MADRVVTCANCGARYNLPASFTAAKATCKKCGSAIDVASSMAAAEEEQAPAAPAPRGRAGANRPGSGARKGEFVKMGTQKSKNGMIIAIGATALTIMGFVLWVTSSGGDKKPDPKNDKTSKTAKADPAKDAANASAKKDAAAAKPADNKPADNKPADAVPAAQKPPEPEKLAANKAEPTKATTKNTPVFELETPKDVPNAGPVRTEIQKMTDKDGKTKDVTVRYKPTPPFDCKSLKPLEFLPTTPKEKVAEWTALAAEAVGDDVRARRAQKKLEEAGREAVPAVINALRELDYSNPDQVITGFQLNKVLERMTKGVNQMYRTVAPEQTPKQDDIYFNNTIVRNWQQFFALYGVSEEEWQKVLSRNDHQDKKLDELGR
jgi:hypothetical protein